MSIAPEWFTPETENDKPNPREFKVRGLDSLEALDITAETTVDEDQLKVSGRGLRSAVRMGLLDWKNVKRDDEDVEFSKAEIALIDPITLQMIGMKVISKTNLSGEQEKN